MNESLTRLEEMGLITDNEGAKVVDLEQYKLGKAVVRKKGAYVYKRRKIIHHILIVVQMGQLSI